MSEGRLEGQQVSEFALWFALLGGAVAWLLHLLAAYVIAEFGCLTGLRTMHWLGITAVAWLVLAVSAAMLLLAAFATWVGLQCDRRLQGVEEGIERRSRAFMARAGWIASLLFLFVIAVETIPVFFYLRDC